LLLLEVHCLRCIFTFLTALLRLHTGITYYFLPRGTFLHTLLPPPPAFLTYYFTTMLHLHHTEGPYTYLDHPATCTCLWCYYCYLASPVYLLPSYYYFGTTCNCLYCYLPHTAVLTQGSDCYSLHAMPALDAGHTPTHLHCYLHRRRVLRPANSTTPAPHPYTTFLLPCRTDTTFPLKDLACSSQRVPPITAY